MISTLLDQADDDVAPATRGSANAVDVGAGVAASGSSSQTVSAAAAVFPPKPAEGGAGSGGGEHVESKVTDAAHDCSAVPSAPVSQGPPETPPPPFGWLCACTTRNLPGALLCKMCYSEAPLGYVPTSLAEAFDAIPEDACEDLDLSSRGALSEADWSSLLSALRRRGAVSALSLRGSPLQDAHVAAGLGAGKRAAALASALGPDLKVLDLANCGLTRLEFAYLCPALLRGGRPVLRELYLSHNGCVGPEEAAALAALLLPRARDGAAEPGPGLAALQLDGEKIGDAGVVALAQALSGPHDIGLIAVGCAEVGAHALLTAAERLAAAGKPLRGLTLTGNALWGPGEVAAASMARLRAAGIAHLEL